jgi:hypothetical protein
MIQRFAWENRNQKPWFLPSNLTGVPEFVPNNSMNDETNDSL